jgi:hypothetical protein
MGSTEGESERRSERGSREVDALGIRLQTRAFLEAARAAGADQAVDEQRRRLIDVYFNSRVCVADLGADVGVSESRARKLLRSGLLTIWRHLPPDLQAAHPAEHVIFLRDNSGQGQKRQPKTPEHRQRISAALQGRDATMKGRKHTAETREKMSRAQKEAWKKRKQDNKRPDREAEGPGDAH